MQVLLRFAGSFAKFRPRKTFWREYETLGSLCIRGQLWKLEQPMHVSQMHYYFEDQSMAGKLLRKPSEFLRKGIIRSFTTSRRSFSEGEDHIRSVLKAKFPLSTEIDVQDVSGGCGSMYQIYIEAEEFRGKKILEQQRMVNAVLETEIKAMHGITLQTAVPDKKI